MQPNSFKRSPLSFNFTLLVVDFEMFLSPTDLLIYYFALEYNSILHLSLKVTFGHLPAFHIRCSFDHSRRSFDHFNCLFRWFCLCIYFSVARPFYLFFAILRLFYQLKPNCYDSWLLIFDCLLTLFVVFFSRKTLSVVANVFLMVLAPLLNIPN